MRLSRWISECLGQDDDRCPPLGGFGLANGGTTSGPGASRLPQLDGERGAGQAASFEAIVNAGGHLGGASQTQPTSPPAGGTPPSSPPAGSTQPGSQKTS